MPGIKFDFLAFVMVFLLLSPTASVADGHYDTDYSDPSDPDGPGFTPPSAQVAPVTNNSVVALLLAATEYCKPLVSSQYLIDCLSERLGEVSRQLNGQKEFAQVQAILETTSKKLNRIARQNRSTTLDAATFSTKGQSPVKTTRRLIPVDEAKLQDALAEAIVVIEEAETLLLRSAEASAERSVQYQRIAAAIGSNKVLLRSS